MNPEQPKITSTSTYEEDASYTDPVAIEQERNILLSMDKEEKLFIAPNQPSKGELEMMQLQLFEAREDLGGKSAYDYFDKIIFGHGEGPANIDQRTFKGANDLDEKYQGTIGDIKERIGVDNKKILIIVCGSNKEDKMTLTKAIQAYFSN
ncbi:MAG: hypothetical protein ACNFW9_02485 [Candidatus Kerfeldbacteria bacterium]